MNINWVTLRHWAAQYGLPGDLVAAVCEVEAKSSFAFRAEFKPFGSRIYWRRWKYLLAPSQYARIVGSTVVTEIIGQSCSWGPMQVMGAVAREHGFEGRFPELCQEAVGLRYGCAQLSKFYTRYRDEAAAVSAYNQGSPRKRKDGTYKNQEYVNKVMRAYKEFRKMRSI